MRQDSVRLRIVSDKRDRLESQLVLTIITSVKVVGVISRLSRLAVQSI
jgi:hypothetical protein